MMGLLRKGLKNPNPKRRRLKCLVQTSPSAKVIAISA
jgi:hypothetical protein